MTALVATADTPRRPWAVAATDPIVRGARLPDGVDANGLSRFGEDVWDLSPLSRRLNAPGRRISWTTFPPSLREDFKRAGWALMNLPTPAALLDRTATARVEHPSVGTVTHVADNWRRYATWLAGRGVARLGQVDIALHEEYATHIARLPLARGTQIGALYAVSLLWGFTPQLPAGGGVPMPPWEADGLAAHLPADAGSNENLTPPIHPAVMSTLLIWALRFVDDFATDILTALAEHQRLKTRIAEQFNPAAAARLRDLLNHHARTVTPLPGGRTKGRLGITVSYLAAITGASIDQTGNAVRRHGPFLVADTAPLDTKITGLLHGQPWRTHIDYSEAPILAMRLATACLIVVAYLSGARPAEVLHLRVGCCPDPADTGHSTHRFRLHGDSFKGARTSDGEPAPDGVPHQWTVIPPVHTAVQILEQLTTTDYLFPLRPAWLHGVTPARPSTKAAPAHKRGHRRRLGDVITAKAANYRIAEFISWVNTYAADRDLTAEAIPDDPDGPVVISRFRRTIAWHIARLPGGRVALAIQYAHLRTTASEGYSGRARHGLRRVLDIETARAMADYLNRVSERIAQGDRVSGPAGRRLIDAARDAATRFEGMFLSPRQVRALLNDPKLQVHDNPQAFLTCAYDPTKALCHPDHAGRGAGQPRLDRCDPACANIARTDEHIAALTAQTVRLREEIDNPLAPEPIRDRLTQHLAVLEQIADRHLRNRAVGGPADVQG